MHEEDPRPVEISMSTEQCIPSISAEVSNDEDHIEEDDRCLHASLSLSKAYLTDFGASNHMVASRKSFITFPLLGEPSSHMGDDSKIPNC